ncbi:inner centromere protein isoform X2 [Paramormyrops kingsleyae]|uniref:Inner centromere protein n=1 Tax=Paramormyrops kingsleyae TaxID=1676925 RepID=A0A3B3R0E6_9TELE|nr:inner centromere protein isoform X2 [Paramormyrops kingsleyae]
MNSLLSTMHSLRELFDTKMKEFADEVDKVHMVWLDEIQEEAVRMFSSDFSAEPELMPKTPSQKKSNRRKRVSVGRTDNRGKRRFSRGARSNLRSSTHVAQTLELIAENVTVMGAGTAPDVEAEQPKRNTRRNRQRQVSMETEVVDDASSKGSSQESGKEAPMQPGVQHAADPQEPEAGAELESVSSIPQPLPPAASPPQLVVTISSAERNSADLLLAQEVSDSQVASKMPPSAAQESGSHAAASRRSSTRRVSVRCSLSGLRRSMTQQAVRRASRRSFLKKKARLSSSSGEVFLDTDGEAADQMDGVLTEEPVEAVVEPEVKVVVEEEKAGEDIRRFTRSMAQTNTPLGPPAPPSAIQKVCTSGSDDDSGKKLLATISSLSTKRLGSSTEDLATPRKKPSPPNKSQSVIKPNMKSFLHTVQKNQILMSTPGSMGRNAIMKSFIKHSTPLRVDLKERERLRLEALKKKQEQELERKKKLEEEKKRKQEEMKRKRDERLRKVVEARVKEEQREEEKKKKIEQKMAQIDEKNDKMRVERIAEEKAKKKVASKRQEELELRKKLQEEEAAKKKMQQEEEKRQQELQAKRRAEEEQERARKLAEARRAQELRREQERQRELEREREREKERLRQQQAAAERERIEREKADALRRELELAAREKERKEAEERRRKEAQERQKAEEEKAALQKQAAAAKSREELQQSLIKTPVGKSTVLNVTVEYSPQSYEITPKGGNKPVVSSNPEDYGMDQNSDDSTDDESAPRKPIPSWAEGRQLQQAMMQQYFNPVDVDSYFGEIEDPQLERIFYKSKPRYFKRTSSAVWHSPPRGGATAF